MLCMLKVNGLGTEGGPTSATKPLSVQWASSKWGGYSPALTPIWQCQGSFYKTTPQKQFPDAKDIHIANYSYFPIQNRRDLECACLYAVYAYARYACRELFLYFSLYKASFTIAIYISDFSADTQIES
jgi:hypothetical protein